jgi:hypothetical protein
MHKLKNKKSWKRKNKFMMKINMKWKFYLKKNVKNKKQKEKREFNLYKKLEN